jgi:hypothetical protein
MIKFLTLRKKNYIDRKKNNPKELDITNWKSSRYSCLKARIYIELSSIFAYLFQFTSITPNQISLMYCFSGVMAGLLLVSNIDFLMIIGLLIFFLKGSLDWTDGLIARMNNQTSNIGHVLDTWGSHIGSISLVSSLGIYCFNMTNNNLFLFIVIFILFLKVIDFKLFSYHQLFYEVINNNISIKIKAKKSKFETKKNLIKSFIKNFMDDRARTVDTICFFLFIEIVYGLEYFSKVFLAMYLMKAIILCFGIFYIYCLKQEIEKKI